MAEEAVKATTMPPPPAATEKEEVVVVAVTVTVTDVPEAEESPNKVDSSTQSPVKPAPEAEEEKEKAETETETTNNADEEKVQTLKEEIKGCETETDTEMKALTELKLLIQEALNNHQFTTTTTTATQPQEAAVELAEETITETLEEKEAAAVEPDVAPTEAEDDNKKEVEVDVPKEPLIEPEPKPTHEPQEEEVKKVNIDEDGTKTVEAIEETVVSVVPSSAAEAASTQVSSPSVPSQKANTPDAKETTEEEYSSSAVSPPPEEVSLWSVPLLKDERTDTILWKFLRARDFRVKDAFAMIKNTVRWRTELGIDGLVEQDLDEADDLAKAAFMHGVTKEGHPVCYNVYGAFQDKELYQKTFSDEQKRERFLKWRIQLLERSVRKLDFSPGGISTIVQVNDLKNSPGPGKWELRQATKQALNLLQDNYPEFVAKQVFINVPWWYMAVNKMISPFLTQRTKSKFVVAAPSKSAETLFNYIAPEQVPVQYGGLSREGEFCTKDGATQIIVKPTSKETVEFAVIEACHLTWEMRVLGWEVNYGAEFVPSDKDGYTVIIQKISKVGATEETIITNSFKTSEPGKVVLTIDNSSSKKKRLLYRLKSNTSCH